MPAPRSTADAAATVRARWRDLDLDLPEQGKWPVDVIEYLMDNDSFRALRALLGPDQWARFKAADPPPVRDDLNDLMTVVMGAYGFGGAGESPASSG